MKGACLRREPQVDGLWPWHRCRCMLLQIEQPATDRWYRLWFENSCVARPVKEDALGLADKRLFPRDCRKAVCLPWPTSIAVRVFQAHSPRQLNVVPMIRAPAGNPNVQKLPQACPGCLTRLGCTAGPHIQGPLSPGRHDPSRPRQAGTAHEQALGQGALHVKEARAGAHPAIYSWHQAAPSAPRSVSANRRLYAGIRP